MRSLSYQVLIYTWVKSSTRGKCLAEGHNSETMMFPGVWRANMIFLWKCCTRYRTRTAGSGYCHHCATQPMGKLEIAWAIQLLFYVMLCDVMLRYVTLRYVTLRYVTSRYVTLRYATLRYVTLRYVMLCYVMLCYVMLCYVMLCYVMLCYVMLCYVMLCYVMLCYVMLCYVRKGFSKHHMFFYYCFHNINNFWE